MSLETEVFCLSTYLGSRSSMSHSVYTCLLSIYSCLRHDPGNSRELQLGPRTPATAPISWISMISALLFKKASYLFCTCARVCGGGTQSWHTWGDQRTSCRNHSSLSMWVQVFRLEEEYLCLLSHSVSPSLPLLASPLETAGAHRLAFWEFPICIFVYLHVLLI